MIEKLAEPLVLCQHPDHSPFSFGAGGGVRSYAPGTYQHTCNGCGRVTVFTIAQVWLGDPALASTRAAIDELNRQAKALEPSVPDAPSMGDSKNWCYCSEYQSSGLPCMPGTCPNVPKG